MVQIGFEFYSLNGDMINTYRFLRNELLTIVPLDIAAIMLLFRNLSVNEKVGQSFSKVLLDILFNGWTVKTSFQPVNSSLGLRD